MYYAALGDRLAAYGSAAAAQERPSPWLVPVELVRSLVVAAVVAGLAGRLDLAGWGAAVALGLVPAVGAERL